VGVDGVAEKLWVTVFDGVQNRDVRIDGRLEVIRRAQ
jgi:hypothetical protein